MSADQHLWIADGNTQKILKYDLNGRLLFSCDQLVGAPVPLARK
jgi:hypothetical protein